MQDAEIWHHHDELSVAKQAMLVNTYGWVKQLAQATQIPYQTLRGYRSHPERLDRASATTVHKIADFMYDHYYANHPFRVEDLPLNEQIKTYQQWLKYSRMYSPEQIQAMQAKLAALKRKAGDVHE